MAPGGRTVHTIGGRYKDADSVEDAPFGELISVRSTGLRFNVVHPIPAEYLADLNTEERDQVREHIIHSLEHRNYQGHRFLKAVEDSLATLEKIQGEMDRTDETTTTTTNTSTGATCHTTHDQRQGSRTSRGLQGTLEWRNNVPFGLAPSVTDTSSTSFRTESDEEGASSRPLNNNQRQAHVEMGPTNATVPSQAVTGGATAEIQLRDQEIILNGIESQTMSCTDLNLRRDLQLAICTARVEITNVRKEAKILDGAVRIAWAQTRKAIELAQGIPSIDNHQAPPTNCVPSSAILQQEPSPAPTNQRPIPPSPAQLASPPPTSASEDTFSQMEDQLRDIDQFLQTLANNLPNLVSRMTLRLKVMNSINKARECIDPVRRSSAHCKELDPELVQELGQLVLEAVQLKKEEAKYLLFEMIEEGNRLDMVDQASEEAANRARYLQDEVLAQNLQAEEYQRQEKHREDQRRAEQRQEDQRREEERRKEQRRENQRREEQQREDQRREDEEQHREEQRREEQRREEEERREEQLREVERREEEQQRQEQQRHDLERFEQGRRQTRQGVGGYQLPHHTDHDYAWYQQHQQYQAFPNFLWPNGNGNHGLRAMAGRSIFAQELRRLQAIGSLNDQPTPQLEVDGEGFRRAQRVVRSLSSQTGHLEIARTVYTSGFYCIAGCRSNSSVPDRRVIGWDPSAGLLLHVDGVERVRPTPLHGTQEIRRAADTGKLYIYDAVRGRIYPDSSQGLRRFPTRRI